MNLKQRAKQLKTNIPIIWLALKHKQTPLIAKAIAVFIMVYALSPIDLIPDFIPILGYLDDIIILPLLIMACMHFIPTNVIQECEQKVQANTQFLEKKWVFAIPFLLIWTIIIVVLIKAFI